MSPSHSPCCVLELTLLRLLLVGLVTAQKIPESLIREFFILIVLKKFEHDLDKTLLCR